MRKALALIACSVVAVCFSSNVLAKGKKEKVPPPVFLYVDAAPNVYGSPDYAPWLENAYANAAIGEFLNMESGVVACNVGTTNFEIEDEVVYSFGDLGKRLTWFYWIPGETVASLTGRFKVALFNTWDGEYLDFYDYYYGQTWLEPTKWIDYDVDGDGVTDGVIGTSGMAWWGAYQVNTQEALEADLAEWGTAREVWEFKADLDGQIFTITSYRKPVRLTDLYAECSADAVNYGAFMECLSGTLNDLKDEGAITGKEKGYIKKCSPKPEADKVKLKTYLEEGDTACPEGETVVDVHRKIVNSLDSGTGQNQWGAPWWAVAKFDQHIKVFDTADGFCAKVTYKGKFESVGGDGPGCSTDEYDTCGDQLGIAPQVTGKFKGGYTRMFTGTFAPQLPAEGKLGTFDAMCDPSAADGDCAFSPSRDWITDYFPDGTWGSYLWWGWTYSAGKNGSWVNAANPPGNSGNIRGD